MNKDLRNNICFLIRGSVYGSIYHLLDDPNYDLIYSSVSVPVCDLVRDSVYNSIWEELYEQKLTK